MNAETSTTAIQKPPKILLTEQEIGDLIDMLSCENGSSFNLGTTHRIMEASDRERCRELVANFLEGALAERDAKHKESVGATFFENNNFEKIIEDQIMFNSDKGFEVMKAFDKLTRPY